MRSLRSLSVDEVIRLEGRVEGALDALNRLEQLWRALERRDLVELSSLQLPDLRAFDGLDSTERDQFFQLQESIVEGLTALGVRSRVLTEALAELMERPVITFDGFRLFQSFEKTGRWLWRGLTAFNLERITIERVSGEDCEVAGVRVPTAELYRLGIPIPPPPPATRPVVVAPRPSPPRPSKAPAISRPQAPVPEAPVDVRKRGNGWATLFAVAVPIAFCVAIFQVPKVVLGLLSPAEGPPAAVESLPAPPSRPATLDQLAEFFGPPLPWDKSPERWRSLRFDRLVTASAPRLVSVARYPSNQPLRSEWSLKDSDRPNLVVVETLLPRALLEHRADTAIFELRFTSGAVPPPIWLDAFAIDNQGLEMALADAPEQLRFRVTLIFLAEAPPSGGAVLRAWNGEPSPSVECSPQEARFTLAPDRRLSKTRDLFTVVSDRPQRTPSP